MKLYNKSGNGLQHGIGKKMCFLPNGGTAEIPDEIAKKWLKIKGVEKYIAPADLERAAKEAKAEAEKAQKALEDENAKLKKKLADLEKAAKEAKAK